MTARVLLIDNYDSFTYNLVQAFRALGAEVPVYRNDKITLAEAEAMDITHLIISPGPGEPSDAGVSVDAIKAFAGRVPILGVCLGHQSIVSAFGGDIVRAERQMHGKVSMIDHDGQGVYAGIDSPMEIGRYHSLIADPPTLPDVFTVTSRTDRGEIMGVRHNTHNIEGVQFHPESVLTPEGNTLMNNFLKMTHA
ncbi:MAG: aminodeoxychorismate/anthranilate synthase component II [Pseudomonadota bacterium]